jgi:hypothetical protein
MSRTRNWGHGGAAYSWSNSKYRPRLMPELRKRFLMMNTGTAW